MPAPAPGARASASEISSLPERNLAKLLLGCVLVVATCGLVYELIAATVASYLLGDSVTQFSLVIGVYLSAMGLGSWLSRFLTRDLVVQFIRIQLIIGLLGGFSAALLFLSFAFLSYSQPILFSLLALIGLLVGLEIPIIMRIMPNRNEFKDLVARVLAFDYVGALLASLLFPLFFLPNFGLVRTSMVFGLLNALVAFASCFAFRLPRFRTQLGLKLQSGALVLLLLVALVASPQIEALGESKLLSAPIALTTKSPYQRITLTRRGEDLRLYLNGNLQFSSRDEYRYHEALVHPAMENTPKPRRVLILGGGDGMAAREVLKYPELQHIDLVDLDPKITALFRDREDLAKLNHHALRDPRLTIYNDDAFKWLEKRVLDQNITPYDAIIIDFPDPNNYGLGKLYSLSFYVLVKSALHRDGAMVVQSTSPQLAPTAFWCIQQTIAEAGLHPRPYHTVVPSFGEWGFSLVTASPRPGVPSLRKDLKRRSLDDASYRAMFVFPPDRKAPQDIQVNRLHDPKLVHYYEQDLQRNWIPGASL